jgi:hypothetical protein
MQPSRTRRFVALSLIAAFLSAGGASAQPSPPAVPPATAPADVEPEPPPAPPDRASVDRASVDRASVDRALVDLAALELGPLAAVVRRGDVVYAAPIAGGVVVVDVSDAAAPRPRRRLLADRVATRLLLDGDRLIVVVLQEEVVMLSVADPGEPLVVLPSVAPPPVLSTTPSPIAAAGPPPPPGAPTPAAPTATAAARGRVVAVTGGRVVFDGGAGAGFARGQRVRVVAQRLVDKPDLVRGGTKKAPSGETTAVVDIEDVDAERAMARLGRGDTAAVGDVVETTDAPLSERIFLPPRAPFSWRTGFHARPFLGLSTSGFPVGMLVDGYVVWTPRDLPIAVLLEAAPAGFALFSQDAHYPIALAAGVTYVTDWFEVGLGGGALIGNEGPCTDDGPTYDSVCEQNTGATFNQFLRLGALDGVHLQWESSIFARAGGFVLGTGRAEVAIPVSSRVGLFGGGGVGENGWAFGEIGVRSMFGGTGGPGTTVLSASLGGAGVFDGRGEEHTDDLNPGYRYYVQEVVAGPAVGFGMEWRL